jgi:hypothetical protein
VRPELREFFHIAGAGEGRGVDVIGQLIHKVGAYLEAQPVNQPTADMPLSEEYFRRVEAIEFAVKSDDGKEPRNLRKADLVLTGVSRTSKTPLSTYLAGAASRWPTCRSCSACRRRPSSTTSRGEGHRADDRTSTSSSRSAARACSSWACRATPTTACGITCARSSSSRRAIFREHPEWMVVDVGPTAPSRRPRPIILERLKDRETSRSCGALSRRPRG